MTPPPASPLEVVACAAHLFATTPRDIMASSRHWCHVRPRWAVAKALRFRGYSYPRIGQILGGFHHTTMLHGVRRADDFMAADYAFADKVATLVALRDGDFRAQQRVAVCKHRIPMLRTPWPNES